MAPEGCLAMHDDPSPFAQAESCNPPVRGFVDAQGQRKHGQIWSISLQYYQALLILLDLSAFAALIVSFADL